MQANGRETVNGVFLMPTAIRIGAVPPAESYIEQWRLLATYRGDQHVVGRFSGTGRYWATPPIVWLDFVSHTAFASDGGRYLLLGEPGSAAAAADFVSLCAIFDERLLKTRDVTEELVLYTQSASE